MSYLYGLIGEKLGHSFSPIIFREFGYPDYQLVPLPADKVIDFIKNTPFRGMNVTIPYKETVMACCDRLSEDAQEIGCVNALVKEADGSISGYNTDVYGIIGVIRNAGIQIFGKKILVLGGGGTSLTARYAAKKMGASEVLFVSRKGPLTYDGLSEHRDVQVIIDTTSVGMYPDNEGELISLDDFPQCEGVIDVVYNPLRTNLILAAKKRNIPCGDGLFMLVEQARIAAEFFTGETITEMQGKQVYKFLKQKLINIVMVGIPGSGKNMIGKILEDVSGREWVDIDTQIEAKSGKSIQEIFIEGGEERYRELERHVIKETAKQTGLLISTGSGAVRSEENLHWLRQNGRIYYIDRDLTVSPAEKMKSSEETEAAHNRMNELEQYRKALEVYDENIFDLLIARNALIEKMMVYKEARQIPIFQPEQEKKKNDLWNAKLNEVRHSDEVLEIMNRILKSSKRIQSRKLFSFNIILIGFMGAGKSTVADFLSTLYAMKVVEMDQVIAEREQMSISDIFATYGEAYFRNLETELLIELQSKKDIVVSCGGGAALREENVKEMKKNGKVVLLTASPEVILDRVKNSDERPLLNGNKNVGFIRDMIEQRRNKYEAAADITIQTDDRTVTEICEELVERLSEL